MFSILAQNSYIHNSSKSIFHRLPGGSLIVDLIHEKQGVGLEKKVETLRIMWGSDTGIYETRARACTLFPHSPVKSSKRVHARARKL